LTDAPSTEAPDGDKAVPGEPNHVLADLNDLLAHNLRAADTVWAAYLNPVRHGDGPRSDA